MRIFVGPVEVAGIGTGLCTGLIQIGQSAQLILSQRHGFSYRGTKTAPWIANAWSILGDFYVRSTTNGQRRKVLIWITWKVWSVLVLLWSLFSYDAFIFLFGTTITNTRAELWIYRILRKKLIFVYLGSDARPPYISGPTAFIPGGVSSETLEKRTRVISSHVKRHERAGICINLPFTAHFHERPYINSLFIGVPRLLPMDDPYEDTTDQNGCSNRPIRILHGPSVPRIKGTAEIERVIDNLKSIGHDLEMILMHGVGNAKMLEEIKKCDLIIDQVYSDLPMSVIAAEGAFYGKPTVVSGYAACEITKFPEWPHPPTLFVHPDALESAVECMITDALARSDLGRKAQAFIRDEWAPAIVAARYVRLLQGDIPEQWWTEPQTIHYAQGCGIPEDTSRAVVRQLIQDFGVEALCLQHNPQLEQFMLAYAETGPDAQ